MKVKVRPHARLVRTAEDLVRRVRRGTQTPEERRRGKMVAEIETMAAAGMLDHLMFIREGHSQREEAAAIASDIVYSLNTETPDERRKLLWLGEERVLKAAGRQRALRGSAREGRRERL